jgi:hypothetical protein
MDDQEKEIWHIFCQWCSPVPKTHGKAFKNAYVIILKGNKISSIIPLMASWVFSERSIFLINQFVYQEGAT